MTFAELIVLALVGLALFYLLRPLRRDLEQRFYRFFRSKMKASSRPVVDITDYAKKKKDSDDAKV